MTDSPNFPRSFDVGHRPTPKWCCQRRLAIVRNARAFRSSAIHVASASRRPLDSPKGRAVGAIGSKRAAISGTPGSTRAAGACGLPRVIT